MSPEEEAAAIADYDVEFTDALLFGVKACSRCGSEKPACATYYVPAKLNDDGLSDVCRACRAQRERERYANDSEYRESRKEKVRAGYRRRTHEGGAS